MMIINVFLLTVFFDKNLEWKVNNLGGNEWSDGGIGWRGERGRERGVSVFPRDLKRKLPLHIDCCGKS